MSIKSIFYYYIISAFIYLSVSCSPARNAGSESKSELLISCSVLYKDVFKTTYYNFSRNNTNCNSCHGIASGPQFSIEDSDLAFSNFYIYSGEISIEDKILDMKDRFYDNATIEPGHKGVGESSNITILDQFEADWNQAKVSYADCIDN